MDDDGAGGDRVAIRVTLTVAGERAIVDFRDSDGQGAGCINCPDAVTRSAVYYCFACLMNEATDGAVPLNGGCFRSVDVVTRPGTVVHAQYPAAVVAGNTETSQRVVDVVLGALAQAMPGRIPAASCGTMSSVALGGDGWTYYETVGGGCGAGPGWGGASSVQAESSNHIATSEHSPNIRTDFRDGQHIVSTNRADPHEAWVQPGDGRALARTFRARTARRP